MNTIQCAAAHLSFSVEDNTAALPHRIPLCIPLQLRAEREKKAYESKQKGSDDAEAAAEEDEEEEAVAVEEEIEEDDEEMDDDEDDDDE